jgi:hypothetical protein
MDGICFIDSLSNLIGERTALTQSASEDIHVVYGQDDRPSDQNWIVTTCLVPVDVYANGKITVRRTSTWNKPIHRATSTLTGTVDLEPILYSTGTW